MGLVAMASFYIYTSFQSKFDAFVNAEEKKLEAVVRTLSQAIDGDQLAFLLNKYPNKGDISSNLQHPWYYKHQKYFKKIQSLNKVPYGIYTLVYDSVKQAYEFGFSSSEIPHYRHIYDDFPPALHENYGNPDGAIINPYRTKTGFWLSAIMPIYDSNGRIVSMLEVDTNFEVFYEKTLSNTINEVWISAGVFLILGFILFRLTRNFLRKEERIKQELVISKKEIEHQNNKITESINYARRIQDSILPKNKLIKEFLPDSFILYMPRDIVSGDFYWFTELEDSFVVAAADCTGHGVPGALMSMIGNTMLTNVVKLKGLSKPSEVLFQLRKDLLEALETDGGKASKDGMDIALVIVDKQKNVMQYAGAYNSLYMVRNGELTETKATKQPIGSHIKRQNEPFDNYEIALEKGDNFYIFSDGYVDQFGGPEGRKLGSKRFKELLNGIHTLSMDDQKVELEKTMMEWKGDTAQLDDILVMGFKI